ncbi:MAG TPA: hypothetical protein VJP59_07955 [Gemmatimonadota bacterium]|nr:hypothetical protein [Gemmatimonadota bacterium]
MSEFRTMAEVRKANASSSQPYWFEAGTRRFFSSRIGRTLYGGRYFITSETPDWDTPRRYSVREVMPDATIETVGKFRAHGTSREARNAIRALLA